MLFKKMVTIQHLVNRALETKDEKKMRIEIEKIKATFNALSKAERDEAKKKLEEISLKFEDF